MIIAFRSCVEGVLLACLAMRDQPDSELIFADDVVELKRKLDLFGSDDQIKLVGFGRSSGAEGLVLKIFGEKKPRMARFDPVPSRYIDLILRHKNCDPAELVRLLISCDGDSDVLYSGKDKLAKRYYNYMREVGKAYERLCMFARPELKGGILSVEIDSPHEISDLFCRWLVRKNADLPVAVIKSDHAWVGNGDFIGLDRFAKITASFIEGLRTTSGADDVDDLWDNYYNSQMIDSRRNHKLAKKVQPKSSASMSKMAKRDRYKVERGIASCTLDGFA